MAATLVDLLLDAAARDPGKVALRRQQASWRYDDLVRGAAAAAARFREAGLEPGDRIALLFRNSPEYVALLYGGLAARLAVVPLNVQERASVLANQVLHSGARLLAGDPEHPEWGALQRVLPESVRVLAVPAPDVETSAASFLAQFGTGDSPMLAAPTVARDGLAILLYTSGTTGRPKGVMLRHGNLVANNTTIIDYLALGPGDVGLTVMPFHFSYGNSVLHTHLGAGATLLLEDNLAFPLVVMQRLQNERVTGFSGVPSTFAILMSRTRMEEFDLRALRYLTQAGGAMPRAAIERVRALVPNARFYVMYGQTEATARLTYLDPDRLVDKLGSIGKALEGVEIEIRDPAGVRLPPHQTGELCARGPNVMLGYWCDEDMTREALEDGWLHTGDLAHTDDEGFLYIDGRLVEMIKVGAFRVSPLEVEEVLATLPGIAEMAVAAMPDELLGQAVKAVLVLREGADLDELKVKAHCRERLASYKVPKVVEFARELPRTASGKIQRYKLA
ncbi:MAG: class I adenylate-forming enzyme family protein [Steroidobacteraceae bacterium]